MKTKELLLKIDSFLCGKMVKINSDSEIISIVSQLSGMFPNSFNIKQEISRFKRLVKKDITYIALGFLYGTHVIAFFHDDFYTTFCVPNQSWKRAYAYVCNTQTSDCSEYGSIFVQNRNGEYYFSLV